MAQYCQRWFSVRTFFLLEVPRCAKPKNQNICFWRLTHYMKFRITPPQTKRSCRGKFCLFLTAIICGDKLLFVIATKTMTLDTPMLNPLPAIPSLDMFPGRWTMVCPSGLPNSQSRWLFFGCWGCPKCLNPHVGSFLLQIKKVVLPRHYVLASRFNGQG